MNTREQLIQRALEGHDECFRPVTLTHLPPNFSCLMTAEEQQNLRERRKNLQEYEAKLRRMSTRDIAQEVYSWDSLNNVGHDNLD